MALSAEQAKALAIKIGYDAAGIARPHSPNLPAWVRSVIVGMHATLDEAFDYEVYITVFTTFGMANAILTEAALSFLGLGVQVPTPSWGNMIYSAQSLTVLESQPWLWMPPGVTIILAVLAINFVGDGLRDALDPRVIL